MIELNGKYANAYIFADIVDSATYGQLIKVINDPVSLDSRLAIMADCHAGAGCVVGTTMLIKDRVCPNLVGVDIGCGMLTLNLGKLNFTNDDFHRFDLACHKIPSGFSIHSSADKNIWPESVNPYEFLKQLKSRKEIDKIERIIHSMGTLGGGNHFIELDISDDGNYYLVIHTGSRNLGKQVCEYYQALAINYMKEKRAIDKLKGTLEYSQDDLAYLEGDLMADYINDLRVCQEFAHLNRLMIADNILKNFFNLNKISQFNGTNYRYAASKDSKFINGIGEFKGFETIHNYIDLNHMILRKGAVSAQNGEMLLIPINMREGSLICVGKGNSEYNYSAPHGAGRIMSRGEAKATLDLESYVKQMEGIYSTTVNRTTLDEAPDAYKPISSILENIKDTVDVIKVIRPIYNFKASGE